MAGIGISVGIARNSLGGALAGASYLLDTYPAFAAYSTRQIAADATNCIICTENGTGTEQIIGFSAGWLDEAAVASHCGANTGSVAQWYDQGGSGYHVTQTDDSAQKEIYDGASILKENLKPVLQDPFPGTGLPLSATIPDTAQPFVVFSVSRPSPTAGFQFVAGTSNLKTGWTNLRPQLWGGSAYRTADLVSDAQHLLVHSVNGDSSIIRADSVEIALGSGTGTLSTGTSLYIGNDSAIDSVYRLQEVVIYTADQTANFAAIEADINAAFSVYA